MIRALVLSVLLAGCASYAGVAVAPNGTVWIVRNTSGLGGSPMVEGIYGCTPHGPELHCSRVEPRGMP